MDQNGYSSNLSSLNSSSSFSYESDETSSFSDESDETYSFSDESVDQIQQEMPDENHVQVTSNPRPEELTFGGLVGSTVGGGVTAPLVSPTNSSLPQSGSNIFNGPYQAPNSVANGPSQANNHPPPQAAPNQRPTAVGNRPIRVITVQDTMRLLEELRRRRSSITPPTSQSSYFSSRFLAPQGFVQPTNTVAPITELPPHTQGPQELAFRGQVGSSSTMGPTSYFPTVGGGVTASLVPPTYSSLPQTGNGSLPGPNIFSGPYQTPNSVGNGPSQANNHPPPPAAPNQRSIPNRVYDPMDEEMGFPDIQTPAPPNNEGNN